MHVPVTLWEMVAICEHAPRLPNMIIRMLIAKLAFFSIWHTEVCQI